MDASSVACVAAASCSSSGASDANSADEAINILSTSSSSLPHSHYLQTCPHLLTASPDHHPTDDSCPLRNLDNAINNTNNNNSSSNINSGELRRQSLKSESYAKSAVIDGCCIGEIDLSNSSRSTSSPQLMCVKPRSKVYRRASLKSLNSIPVMSSSQSRIMKISSSRNKIEKRLLPEDSKSEDSHNDKENVICSPLSNPYPYSTPCQKIKNNNCSSNNDKLSEESHQDEEKQQAKGRSCSSFLPILSLIPHTVISFQYPSAKMKFSWWRNKIS